jgi:hypothetical protein
LQELENIKSMIICFELTMPNRASWNGRWSGEGKKFYLIKKVSDRYLKSKEHFKELLEKNRDSWYYRWPDGWGASVIAEIIDSKEAAKRRKLSVGFCGYEWMVDSIMWYGEISTVSDRKKELETAK